jgi:hypothetical protein
MKEVESDGGASVETAAAIYASMVGSLGIDATPHYMLPRCVAAAAAVCKDMQHPTIDNAKARALVEDPEVGGVPCRMEWMLQGLVVDYWQGEDVHLHRMYFRELAWAGQCCRASWCAMAHCLEVEAAKSAAEAAGAVTLLFADSLLGSQWKCIFQAGTMLSFAGYRLEAWTVRCKPNAPKRPQRSNCFDCAMNYVWCAVPSARRAGDGEGYVTIIFHAGIFDSDTFKDYLASYSSGRMFTLEGAQESYIVNTSIEVMTGIFKVDEMWQCALCAKHQACLVSCAPC